MSSEMSNFWSGMNLVIGGLVDATKKASYCLGLGVAGLGTALLIFKKYEIMGIEATLISLASFFVLARLGKSLDEFLDRKKADKSQKNVENHKNLRKIQHQLERSQVKQLETSLEMEKKLENFGNEIKPVNEQLLYVQREMLRELARLENGLSRIEKEYLERKITSEKIQNSNQNPDTSNISSES